MIVAVLVTVMIVVHPCVGMTVAWMTVVREVVMLGNHLVEDPLGVTEKNKRSKYGLHLQQEIWMTADHRRVTAMTADHPHVTVMTVDRHVIVMTADHRRVTEMTVDHVTEMTADLRRVTEMTAEVVEAGVVLLVMTAADLTAGMTVVMIVVRPCVEMIAKTAGGAEVGEVHREMTADLQTEMSAEVMTVETEDSVVVVVTAIVEMTAGVVMTAVKTTGVQDLVDFHPRHVMIAGEVMTATVVKDSLQGMRGLLSVHRNRNNSLQKGERLLMDGPLWSNVNMKKLQS